MSYGTINSKGCLPRAVNLKIEMELKAKVKFRPTDEGREFDYIYLVPRFIPEHE